MSVSLHKYFSVKLAPIDTTVSAQPKTNLSVAPFSHSFGTSRPTAIDYLIVVCGAHFIGPFGDMMWCCVSLAQCSFPSYMYIHIILKCHCWRERAMFFSKGLDVLMALHASNVVWCHSHAIAFNGSHSCELIIFMIRKKVGRFSCHCPNVWTQSPLWRRWPWRSPPSTLLTLAINSNETL